MSKRPLTRAQEKAKREKKKRKPIDFEDFIRECNRDIEKVNRKLEELIKHKKDFDSDLYRKGLARFGFDANVEILKQNLSILLKNLK